MDNFEIFKRMLASQENEKVAQDAGLSKEAKAQMDQQIAELFVQDHAAAGHSQEQLAKFASDHPAEYQQHVEQWLATLPARFEEAEKLASMQKQAEAEMMNKVAEDVYHGRVMAHAFYDELANIVDESMKLAQDLPFNVPPEEGAEKEEKKEEKDEKKEEKKDEEKDEGTEEEKKEAAARNLPIPVLRVERAIFQKVASSQDLTPEESRFLNMVHLANAGFPVNWSG